MGFNGLTGQQRAQLGLQRLNIRADRHIHNRDDPPARIIQRQAGGTGLLAQHIDRAIGQRQNVGDFVVADHRLGNRPIRIDDLAFVDRHFQCASVQRWANLPGLGSGRKRDDCGRNHGAQHGEAKAIGVSRHSEYLPRWAWCLLR